MKDTAIAAKIVFGRWGGSAKAETFVGMNEQIRVSSQPLNRVSGKEQLHRAAVFETCKCFENKAEGGREGKLYEHETLILICLPSYD